MDHRQIEEENVAARYLRRELPAATKAQFERHFVDCPECMDRIALAEMFGEPPPTRPLTISRRKQRWRRNLLLAMVMSAVVGGPVAFWAGQRMGARCPAEGCEIEIRSEAGAVVWQESSIYPGIVVPRRTLSKGKYEVTVRGGSKVLRRYAISVEE